MEQSLFRYNAQNTVKLFFLIVLSIIIMTADQRFHYLESTRSVISHVLYPIRYIINIPSDILKWSKTNLSSRQNLIAENNYLKEQTLLLQSDLQKYEILEHENQRLRALFHSAKKIKNEVLITELLAIDLDPYRQQIVINQGKKADTYIGQALIDANGIVGQIIHTDSYSSTALLISDPNHALPVKINRSGLRTIALGTGSPNQLKLAYIPESSDIKEGDLVVSSGLGGHFPSNYPVATVTSIEHISGQPFSNIYAKPLAKLDQANMLLLVWHNRLKGSNNE